MWMKSLPLAQPPNVKAQHRVLGGLDDSGSRRDGMAADVALNSICRPSGTLIYASTQHFMPKTRHFMLGFHIRRLRRGWAFGMSTSISCGAFI